MKLPYSRYEEIKNEVVNLFQQTGIDSAPVNVWFIAQQMGIRLIPFSSLPAIQQNAVNLLSNGGLKFRMVNQYGDEKHCIIYDDSVPNGRIRFSILHEIGHIVLGHKQDSTIADAEADFFAKYAIAPPMLVHLICPLDYKTLAQSFGLSEECAYNSMNYYIKWLGIPNLSEYEYRLIDLFTTEIIGGGRVLRVNQS